MYAPRADKDAVANAITKAYVNNDATALMSIAHILVHTADAFAVEKISLYLPQYMKPSDWSFRKIYMSHNETPTKGNIMSNEEYFKHIYKLKFAIDALDEAYYSLENPSDEDFDKYVEDRAKLCAALEEAHKA